MATDTAVIALHFQNEVIHPDGHIAKRGNAEQVASRGVLQNVQRVFKSARDSNRPIIHVGSGGLRGHPGVVSSAPLFRDSILTGAMLRGSWGTSFHEDAAPAPGEAVLYHSGILSFPGTGLQELLDGYGVRRVFVFGVATRLVVQAAVFEFSDRGYETHVVEDCCAAGRAELHHQAIEIIRLFANVVTSNEAAELLKH